MEERRRLILFPIRRRLAVLCAAYLAGIYAALIVSVPVLYIGMGCAFCLTAAVLRLKRRKSALFCVAAVLLLVGNGLAGGRLALRDAPSRVGASLVGEVQAFENGYRLAYVRGPAGIIIALAEELG